ncbi:OmpA family protein [uncultured Thiohalocapsa sp.]|uniref:OmpA family protein n=1 Tax=uncultured Thiohalocapsa sp. TaxID=768990 RepID=UPI0025D96587|nr:OmpA family protein [uncultured Thiohalocapsa sp.]
MTQPSPTAAAPSQRRAALRNTLVLGTLAALFAGGTLLLHALTRGEAQPLPAQPTATTQHGAATPATATPKDPAPGSTANPAVTALARKVEALETTLADARGRLDSLNERTAAFAEASARIDTLAEQVAAARRTADTAAAQAAAMAERYGSLTADYARLGARFTPAGVLIRLDATALAFAPGSAELPAPAAPALAEIADFLNRHPRQRVLLRGHTDATGAADANLALSEARAAAVQDALVALGVAPERLRSEGVGAAEPIAGNASADGRRRNRRVDILLKTPSAATG